MLRPFLVFFDIFVYFVFFDLLDIFWLSRRLIIFFHLEAHPSRCFSFFLSIETVAEAFLLGSHRVEHAAFHEETSHLDVLQTSRIF